MFLKLDYLGHLLSTSWLIFHYFL